MPHTAGETLALLQKGTACCGPYLRGTFAFSSSNQFWIRLMCVTTGAGLRRLILNGVEPLAVRRHVVASRRARSGGGGRARELEELPRATNARR